MEDKQSPDQATAPAGAEEVLEISVYRSARRAETYIYLPVADEFDTLPVALRKHFGEATAFLTFELHANKVLAQADAKMVLQAIAQQGFYVQLPPPDPALDGPQKPKP